MPCWFSGLSKRSSMQPVRYTEPEESRIKHVFKLPTDIKAVKVAEIAPRSLPRPEANFHEVRFFLYHLLTYKGHRIAQQWPQWILETVAFWKGTGAELRAYEGDFSLLCPLNGGHAELDKGPKYVQSPSGDCRQQIGLVIEITIKRLKAREEDTERLHREWKNTQLGKAARERINNERLGSVISSTDYVPASGFQTYPISNRAPSFVSQKPNLYPTSIRYNYGTSLEHSQHSHRAPSMYGSTYAPMPTLNEAIFQRSDMTTTCSGDGSNSENTNSTMKTTPPGSSKGEIDGRTFRRAPSICRPNTLTRENLHLVLSLPSNYSPSTAPSISSDTASCRSSLQLIRSQQYTNPSFYFAETPSRLYPQYSLAAAESQPSIRLNRLPSSVSSHMSFAGCRSGSESPQSGLRNFHFEQSPRKSSTPSILSHNSQTGLHGTLSPSFYRRPTISTNSISYPQPNIAACQKRIASSAPSQVSSQVRTATTLIFGQFFD